MVLYKDTFNILAIRVKQFSIPAKFIEGIEVKILVSP